MTVSHAASLTTFSAEVTNRWWRWTRCHARSPSHGRKKDTLLPVELYETAVKERLPGAVLTILPGVGHMPMLDDPELVARTILAVTSAAVK